MGSRVATSESPTDRHIGTRPRVSGLTRGWIIGGTLILTILISAVVLYRWIWPFSEKSVLQDLSEASDSTVTTLKYHAKYFPPGCVLEGLEFRHGADHFKLITIEKLIIEGSYVGILRRHVPRIVAVGAHVFVPAFGSKTSFDTKHSKTAIDRIVVNGSIVDFESKDPNKQPFRFEVHEASFDEVRWGSPIGYHLKFHNPNPPGEISINGKFGAWIKGRPGEVPLSGEYKFEHANLGVYGGIAGILSSQGKFDGHLQHLTVAGTTEIPDFEVRSGGHKVRLETKFNAYVDGLNGDTFLNRVDAHFGRTNLVGEGSIAGVAGRAGKFTELKLAARQGRIEDILGLFVTNRSPMSGETALHAKAEIPPGKESFLKKVKLEGTFGIDDGSFAKPETQKDVNALSAGARGENQQQKEDPETVLTDLKGRVRLANGLAQFSELSFAVPGTNAEMHGKYSILNHAVDLHGQMRVDTKISKTSSGAKALLLKIMDPIFKKKKHGEVVPVHITGTYEKPQFGLDLGNKEGSTK